MIAKSEKFFTGFQIPKEHVSVTASRGNLRPVESKPHRLYPVVVPVKGPLKLSCFSLGSKLIEGVYFTLNTLTVLS